MNTVVSICEAAESKQCVSEIVATVFDLFLAP